MAYCMACGEEKTLKAPAKGTSVAIEEDARDAGAFNYRKAVGFCGAACATKAMATHITRSGGKGYHCVTCGNVIGETCTCG